MAALPPVPRDEAGPCPDKDRIISELCPGIVGACCVCDHGTGWWWRQDRDYHPLHDRCVERLIEMWAQMTDTTEQPVVVSSRRTGAYARRAGAVAARPATTEPATPVRTRTVSRDGGSPYFRPGMPEGAPWIACVLTTAGLSITPCSANEQAARSVAGQWAALGRGQFPHKGAQVAGAWVVGPDGTVIPVWGETVMPGAALPWEPLTRLARWETCRGCSVRMWPGRWRGERSGLCLECLRREPSVRPSWPEDTPCSGVDPLTVVPKKKARREKVRAVD